MSSMLSPEPTITAGQLLALPDDGARRELVRGELRTMSPAGHWHGRVAARVARDLGNFVADQAVGEVYAAETGFWIARDPDTVRAPDVAFVTAARAAAVADAPGFFPGAPDLAVEVVSPSDTFTAVMDKAFAWIDAGSAAVWIVDPRSRSVAVIRARDAIQVLDADAALETPELLPGFAVRVGDLFAT